MHEEEAGAVRQLIELLREFDLDAIRVRIGETEVEVVGREPAPAGAFVPAASAGPGAIPAAAGAAEPAAAAPAAAAGANVRRVTAPVVGVFYAAPSPGADPFVAVGDRVAPGQVVCILEAMKLMNEITSDVAGIVTRVLPENGQLVSLGDDLFWIEP
jgi:acetyl-CoA carboxylase biotin carboxyl carrier protein